MAISFRIDQTPNPNAIKITLTKTIFEGDKSYTFKKDDNPENPIVASLLKLQGEANVSATKILLRSTKNLMLTGKLFCLKLKKCSITQTRVKKI